MTIGSCYAQDLLYYCGSGDYEAVECLLEDKQASLDINATDKVLML